MRTKLSWASISVISKERLTALNARLWREFFEGLSLDTAFNESLASGLGFSGGHASKSLASVPRLLASSRPSDVARFVIAVVVDAVNRMVPRRLVAKVLHHVSQKSREVMSPLRAQLDTPCAIAPILLIAWVVAPLLDRDPEVIQRVDASYSRQTVCDFAHNY
jgi:hypothetical protein